MRPHMLQRLSLLLFFLFLFFPVVSSALGVTPGKTLLDFFPNLQITKELTVINSEERTLSLSLETTGDLAPYLTLSKHSATLLPGTSLVVPYTVHLPEKFSEPGEIAGMIILRETLPGHHTGNPGDVRIGALTSVGSVVQVSVPYTGRTLEASFYIPPIPPYAPVDFLAQVKNVGDAYLSSVRVQVALSTPDGKSVTPLSSEKLPLLAPHKRRDFVLHWDPHVFYGEYHAIVTFFYGNRKQELETDFSVGSFTVDMIDLRVEDFVFSSQARLVATLFNAGDEDTSVTTQLILRNEEGRTVFSPHSQTLSVASRQQQEISYSWNLENTPVGRYKGILTLTVGETTLERPFYILMTENGISAAFTPLNSLTGKTVSFGPTHGNYSLSTSSLFLYLFLLIAANIILFSFLRLRGRQKTAWRNARKRS